MKHILGFLVRLVNFVRSVTNSDLFSQKMLRVEPVGMSGIPGMDFMTRDRISDYEVLSWSYSIW